MIIFGAIDKLKRKIKFTLERKEHIAFRHPEITEFELFEAILRAPELIKCSSYDSKVLLYYRSAGEAKDYKYLVLVVKVLNGEGFILTAYKTNTIKEGKEIWKS